MQNVILNIQGYWREAEGLQTGDRARRQHGAFSLRPRRLHDRRDEDRPGAACRAER